MPTTARDQILETTCALLEAQGYHATGLNQIIQESGSPKGSLYYYFPGGKEELTAEALTRVGAHMVSRSQAKLALHDDAAESISAFILTIARGVESSGYRMGAPITAVAIETANTSERLRGVCAQIYAGLQAAFRDTLIAGGAAPERAERLAALIIAAIEGGVILARTAHSPRPLEDIAAEMRVLIRCAVEAG